MDELMIIKDCINKSLNDLYEKERTLFEYADENNNIKVIDKKLERNKVFHFGRYFYNHLICGYNQFSEYNLDEEYYITHDDELIIDKSIFIENMINRSTVNRYKEGEHNASPDLIVHKRGPNKDNLIVMEFKCNEVSPIDEEYDIKKLMFLTKKNKDKRHNYNYKYGFYILLTPQKEDIKISLYQKGKKLK